MPTLPDWAIQVLQVVAVLALAPLVNGIIARAEAIVSAVMSRKNAAVPVMVVNDLQG